ncbi:MAG: aldo/keto reductase [Acidimicrobiales bacterium]|jgi:voltage-dependent potassium channel beta subunit
MPYRRLGRSGLKVSLLSFGSWISFANQLDDDLAVRCLAVAREAGVNFFDNAESYAGGQSEAIMGRAFKTLGWERYEYVVSSKFFWGIHDFPNMTYTLNRKYLIQAVDASLKRLGLDFLDLIFCHRADPETPIEETVRAMSDIVSSGKALYWGTSEWAADEIVAAIEIAERHHLYKPVMEQPEYNLLHRRRVEQEYARLLEDYGIGLTTFSPLATGLLTGKYLEGIPENSRGTLAGFEWLRPNFEDLRKNDKVRALKAIADDLGCPLAQLAIAWCASNPKVSTVIMGASRVEQLQENLRSLEVLERLDDEVMRRINEVAGEV